MLIVFVIREFLYFGVEKYDFIDINVIVKIVVFVCWSNYKYVVDIICSYLDESLCIIGNLGELY